MIAEPAGQTLQPTALVHEAYLRLVGSADVPRWQTRGHFFAAAAEAMRRILIESARRKLALKHGGGRQRVDLRTVSVAADLPPDDLFDLDRAFTAFEAADPEKAALVRLRFFGGLSVEETASVLEISSTTVKREWATGRAWLFRAMNE